MYFWRFLMNFPGDRGEEFKIDLLFNAPQAKLFHSKKLSCEKLKNFKTKIELNFWKIWSFWRIFVFLEFGEFSEEWEPCNWKVTRVRVWLTTTCRSLFKNMVDHIKIDLSKKRWDF